MLCLLSMRLLSAWMRFFLLIGLVTSKPTTNLKTRKEANFKQELSFNLTNFIGTENLLSKRKYYNLPSLFPRFLRSHMIFIDGDSEKRYLGDDGFSSDMLENNTSLRFKLTN